MSLPLAGRAGPGGTTRTLALSLDGLSERARQIEAEKEEIRARLNSNSRTVRTARTAKPAAKPTVKNTITPRSTTPRSTFFTTPFHQIISAPRSTGKPSRPSFPEDAGLQVDDLLAKTGMGSGVNFWWDSQQREKARERLRARTRDEAAVAAAEQDLLNSRYQLAKERLLSTSPSDRRDSSRPSIIISDPQLAIEHSVPQYTDHHISACTPPPQPVKDSILSISAAVATPEPMQIQCEPSLTKNMISPIVQVTPKSSAAGGQHGSVWPDPKQPALPPTPKNSVPEFQNYERLVAQRDTKIGILQKQVDVLKASLREKGMEEAEKALSGLLLTNDSANAQLTALQAEAEEARKEAARERDSVEKLKKKQTEDIKELRKLYEEVVHENAKQQAMLLKLEDTVRHKGEALLMWQRSHGELEEELDRTVVKVSQMQNSHINEREEHSKNAESFHKTVLEHTKQLDAVRKDRDNLAAELRELKGVLQAHEGAVSKLQDGRKEEEIARERLMQELEATQAEANALRHEVVTLQNQAISHQANIRHEKETCRQLDSTVQEMKEAREKLESAWATKVKGLERANTEAEQAQLAQTKRWNQMREAHERALEMVRTELSQVTTDCRDAERLLQHMTRHRDELKEQSEVLTERLTNEETQCHRLSQRVAELETSKEAQQAQLKEGMEKLCAAREEAVAVKKDYAALVEAGSAKDNALRCELAEVHRRAAANERAANDALTQERREREKECTALRMEIFSLRETDADRDDHLQRAEQQRDTAESALRVVESELDASKARELEALARVDEIMKDFSSETQTLRSKVTELSRALREAEDSRLNVGQTAKMLESQLQQEERAWQSKSWDLQKQMQAAEERLEMERQVVAAAVSKTQSVMQQLRQLYLDMRQFEVVLKDEQYQHKQLQRQLYTLKMEESKRDDMLMRTANELGSLKVEQEYLKKQNEVLVDQIGSSDTDAGLEGFARGVEKCQAELKAQAERTREAVQEMAQMKLDVSAKDKLLKEMEDAMHKLREQRSELETLLAMERAARTAVEKASVNLSRSTLTTPYQTPSRTATKNLTAHRGGGGGNFLEGLSEAMGERDRSPGSTRSSGGGGGGEMGRHPRDILLYSSPDKRVTSPRGEGNFSNSKDRISVEEYCRDYSRGSNDKNCENSGFSEIRGLSDSRRLYDEPHQHLM